MSILTETFELANQALIPKVGFGTWQIPAGQKAYDAVATALKAGYRHIDTAKAYENEKSVGQAIRESGIPRSQIYVTSKLPAQTKTYQGALDDFDATMKSLDIEYLDLYLIHAPWPWNKIGENHDEDNIEVWRAMEKIYASHRVKAIGVSNFNVHDLKNIMKTAEIIPMVDQIQYYIGFTEPKIVEFANEHNILVEAYSPLATGGILDNIEVQRIAENYHVSIAQLALRFCIQNGVLPLPKAVSPAHIKDNANLDFAISEADMKVLNAMPDAAPAHTHNLTQG